jgi:hypothetical protein
VAPVHHSRSYVVATLKSFREHPMAFTVGSGNVLATDASSIFGRISLGGECEAMPLDDVRQLQRVLFVDFIKAFDTVPREMLLKVLARLGFPPKIINPVRVFHENVTLEVDQMTTAIRSSSSITLGSSKVTR